LTEPTYANRERFNLPLPLIGAVGSINGGAQPDLAAQRQTQHQEIDRVLAQVLVPLGVKFKFSIQPYAQPQPATDDSEQTIIQSPDDCTVPLKYRLWVRCSAQKSLDCQLIAVPLAQALRALDLQDFRDALVEFSAANIFTNFGANFASSNSNWQLKLDLTPPLVRLRHWARWGDVQAITRLLNLALAPEGVRVSATFENLTIKIACKLIDRQSGKFPLKKPTIDRIAPLLIELSPQGIQGATIHGMQSQRERQDEPPVWVHWLDLPALGNPKFSPTPIILAGRGHKAAIKFILERLLNPDLDRCFEVGGISLSLLYRQNVLYVMSEAPTCPIQSQVTTTVIKVLRQLAIPAIHGVCVSGRISGQKLATWTHGVDFERTRLELPPVAPAARSVPEPALPPLTWTDRITSYLTQTGIWTQQVAMTSTSQLVYKSRFQWQPAVLLCAIGCSVAIVSDVAMKFALESRNLTTKSPATAAQLSFNNPLLEQKLAQYQLRCVQDGVPDVLIIGSSRAMRGVDPTELRRSLAARGYTAPKIYNFGINGATAQVVDLVLRQLLTPQQLPKLVIWVDGARAFNSGRTDRTYDTIASSDRFQQLALMSGIKNEHSSLMQVQSSFKNTYQALDSRIDRKFAQISPAYYHRARLKTWLQSQAKSASKLALGDNDLLLLAPVNTSDRQIDADGYLALDVSFNPTTYYHQYTRVTGDSDGDYLNFQLTGTQDRALRQVTDLLADRNIPLIFVNAPLSDFYLDKVRSQHELIFKSYMQQVMAANRLTFIDLGGLLTQQYDRFSDPSHLNQVGARDVSRYLAQSTMIPWQTLTDKVRE
jgi:hypothetical protein